jgi:hypothetical protein
MRPGHSAKALGLAYAVRSLPGTDQQPACAAHEPAKPARAQHPHDALERTWLTPQPAVRISDCSVVRPTASSYGTIHGKVFTVSTQGARRTRLTRLEAPVHFEEGGRRRSGAHWHGRRRRSSTTGKVPILQVGKQLWALAKL